MPKFTLKKTSTSTLTSTPQPEPKVAGLVRSSIIQPLGPSVRSGVWDLNKDGLTQGLLGAFSTCPEKVRLGYVEGLSSRFQNGPIKFGNIIHDTLDTVYSGFLHPEKVPPYAFLYVEGLEKPIELAHERAKMVLTYKENLDRKAFQESRIVLPKEETTIEEHYGKAHALIPAYLKRWQTDFDTKRTNWIDLEKQFDFWTNSDKDFQKLNNGYDPFAEWSHRARGKWDGLFRGKDGKIWLLETKTKGRINEDQIMDMLNLDLQVGLYLYAIWMIYGEIPGGVLYNVIRTPQLKQHKAETLSEFIKRVSKDIEDRPDWYFYRYDGNITQKDLQAFRANFKPQVDRLEAWVRGGSHYRNTKACVMGGVACTFLPICSKGDRTKFIKRSEPFAELSDDLVE